MDEETTTKAPKNWSTKTVINRFARKVEEVIGGDVFNVADPVRGLPLGDVLDHLINADLRADYGSSTVAIPGQSTVDGQIEGVEGI